MNGNTRTKLNLGSQHENTSHLLKMQLKNLEVEEKNQHKCVNVNVILLLLVLVVCSVLTFEISFSNCTPGPYLMFNIMFKCCIA